jgi:multiple sugar transport system ATP-binding protein
MGRALVRNPTVFLMDEPLSNLDAKLRVQIRTEISALQRRMGTTTIYVTHDQVEAMTLGQRVTVLSEGEIQQVATPEELYSRPANVFVAGFLGTPPMNLLPGRLLPSGSGGVELRFGGITAELPTEAMSQPDCPIDEPLIVGIRPEAIIPARTSAACLPVELKVEAVESLGHERLIYGRLPQPQEFDSPVAQSLGPSVVDDPERLVARVPPDLRAEPGETIPLWMTAKSLYFFRSDGAACQRRD